MSKAWEKANPERARESHRLGSKRWREKHPDRVREIRAKYDAAHPERRMEWYKNNPERARNAQQKWQKNNPEKVRALRIKHAWKMSPEEYDGFIDKEGTLCPICKKSFGEVAPCLDHNHKTGKIRGVLCRRCNSGIGLLCENIDILLSAVEYLRRDGHDPLGG